MSGFCKVGTPPFQASEDLHQINTRRRSGKLKERNDDPLAYLLYPISEFSRLNMEPFLNDMRRLLMNWTDEVVKLSERSVIMQK